MADTDQALMGLLQTDNTLPDAKAADQATPAPAAEATPQPANEAAPAGAEPAQGTPDKALQQVQQDLSATTRLVQDLLEKVNTGQQLTPQQQQKLDKGVNRIEQIQKFLADRGAFDPFEHTPVLAEQLVEVSEKIGKLETLEQRMARLEQTQHQATLTDAWGKVAKLYPGVDVHAIWQKAEAEAAETLGEDASDAAVHRLANRWFHERSAAATKRVEQKTEPKAAPITPGGAKVTNSNGGVEARPAPTRDEADMSAYLALVK